MACNRGKCPRRPTLLAVEPVRVFLFTFDASVHIRNALELVQNNLGLGVLLALIILWLFLRDIKTTLIIAMTIPVSLMVAFAALSVFDRSLNVISLAGLAFSVGLVLDAAIIVQENIVRLRSQGLDKSKAVMRGALQVTGALFASTATSVAIFLPILFMAGIEGQLFSDLALTLSIAVIASFVSCIDSQDPAPNFLARLGAFAWSPFCPRSHLNTAVSQCNLVETFGVWHTFMICLGECAKA